MESVYEKSLALWLLEHGLEARMQVPVDVFFRGQQVGEFRADLLVNDTVIVEIKSARSLYEVHEVQLVNYLVATRKPVGLLIRFGPAGVEVKRKVRTLPNS